uniref:Uncharacterized protein n=1 Tax=Tetranychus urticae TaxID=32264 RepID=A0A158P520_TETUR
MDRDKNYTLFICSMLRFLTIEQNELNFKAINQTSNCDSFAFLVFTLLLILFINLIYLCLRIALIESQFLHYVELIRTLLCIIQLIIICRQRFHWINLLMFLKNHNLPTNHSNLIYLTYLLITLIVIAIDCASWFVDQSDNYISIDDCFDFFFIPLKSHSLDLPYYLKLILVIFAIIFYSLIIHGTQLIMIIYTICVTNLTLNVISNFSTYMQSNLVDGGFQINGRLREKLFRIRLIVKKIDQLRRQFDDSLNWLPFVWILGHLFESFACLIEYLHSSSFTESTHVIHLTVFLRKWSLFSLTSFISIILSLMASQVKHNCLSIEEKIFQDSSEIIDLQSTAKSNVNLDEILFKMEITRWKQMISEPQSTRGINLMNQSFIPLIVNTLLPMVFILSYKKQLLM